MVNAKEISLAKELKLLDLHDDCLKFIFEQLNVVEQFLISKLHSRFKDIIHSLWRLNLKNVIVYPAILECIDERTFVDFMSEVSVFMESLLMRHCDIRFLRLLGSIICQRTETFTWMGVLSNPVSDVGDLEELKNKQFLDEDVNMLADIFPNLKVLKLRGCQITGKHLSKLGTLRHLTLDKCQFLDSYNFQDIFHNLKLRKFDIMEDCDEIDCSDLEEIKACITLEHIKIADYHLSFDTDMLNDILGMPRMKKLSIYSKNFVFDVLERISQSRLKQIEAFKFKGVLHNFARFFQELTNMRELKKLSLSECCSNDIDCIPDHVLNEISKELPNLEEIHLCFCNLESENGVLSVLRNCHQLKVINLTSTRKGVNVSMIRGCMDLIKKQKWRTTGIEIWLKNTDIDKSILEDPRYMYNRFLKLNFKYFLVDSNPLGVLKFTFTS